jgi:hypothetical protein
MEWFFAQKIKIYTLDFYLDFELVYIHPCIKFVVLGSILYNHSEFVLTCQLSLTISVRVSGWAKQLILAMDRWTT